MLPLGSREISPAQTMLLAHRCWALASIKTGASVCGGETVFSAAGATAVKNPSAGMDSSDMQRKKVAVIGGGLVRIDLYIIPVSGIMLIVITLNG